MAEKEGLMGLSSSSLLSQTPPQIHALLLKRYPEVYHIISHMMQAIHTQAFQQGALLQDASQHERLFEMVMAHFDELQPYRQGVKKLWRDITASPSLLVSLSPYLSQMTARILRYAGIPLEGFAEAIQIWAFQILLYPVFTTWLNDLSADMSKTLSALDRALTAFEEGRAAFKRFLP